METKQQYNCDICDKRGNGNYYACNSTYGYCDDIKCKDEASAKLGADIYDACGAGVSLVDIEDLIGDRDIFEFI